jgi:hypothetical protein
MSRLAKEVRFSATLLALSWLCGSGALNLGLLREDGGAVAIVIFALACVVWWLAYAGRALHLPAFLVLGFWGGNLVLAAIVGKDAVYRTAFFQFATSTLVLVILGALVFRPTPGKKGVA